MILGYIIAKNKKHAKEIAKLLLALDLETAHIGYEKQTIIEGKTKALLFSTINQILRITYPENMPMFYAVPIIYMDAEQTQTLYNQTAKV